MNANANDDRHARRLIFALLVLVALALLAAEVMGRFVVPRISRIEGRVERELRDVKALPRAAGEPKTLLLYGNSLLDTAVPDAAPLEASLAGQWRVRRLVVQATQYLDWRYGLRNLLQSGESRQVVALMLSPQQLLSNQVRGAYSAYRLFGAADSLRAGVEAGMHPTEISGLVVGHYSGYYGLRLELRKFAFQKLVPQAETLTAALLRAAPRAAEPSAEMMASVGARRLAELRELCDARGVTCVLLVPPEIRPSKLRAQLIGLAEAAGLQSSRFDPAPVWPASHFDVDEFHFSPTGARAYAEFLVQRMQEET